mmetsp:Transcript_18009/g.55950  ORF Transcript_18009/g.55950 Transcript_18009/m.55950 type:complete len:269 (+) Transcript_18009:778-1584(+)
MTRALQLSLGSGPQCVYWNPIAGLTPRAARLSGHGLPMCVARRSGFGNAGDTVGSHPATRTWRPFWHAGSEKIWSSEKVSFPWSSFLMRMRLTLAGIPAKYQMNTVARRLFLRTVKKWWPSLSKSSMCRSCLPWSLCPGSRWRLSMRMQFRRFAPGSEYAVPISIGVANWNSNHGRCVSDDSNAVSMLPSKARCGPYMLGSDSATPDALATVMSIGGMSSRNGIRCLPCSEVKYPARCSSGQCTFHPAFSLRSSSQLLYSFPDHRCDA